MDLYSESDILDPMNIMFSSDSDDDDIIEISKKKRKYWVRPYYLERATTGAFISMFRELEHDPQLFYSYTRMSKDNFDELLAMVGPHIQKQNITREPLSPTLRLAVTLRYLATGESQSSLAMTYKCSQTSVHRIVTETTKSITAVLAGKVFPKLTMEYFKGIAAGFEERWNFPNCIGAIDGKHVTIQAPYNSGSEFFNYKKTSSIVLMAICDHEYNFMMCNVGAAGRQSDGGAFRESKFGKDFYDKTLPIPPPRNVTETFIDVPYVFVADDAFALHENMLKPYTTIKSSEQRIFNYRLSRARRMIENCFGILSAKWRIFRTPINAEVCLVEQIVLSSVCLHNWLRKKNNNYIFTDSINRETGSQNNQPNALLPLQPSNRNSTTVAKSTRDKYAVYFSGEGQVEWQNSKI